MLISVCGMYFSEYLVFNCMRRDVTIHHLLKRHTNAQWIVGFETKCLKQKRDKPLHVEGAHQLSQMSVAVTGVLCLQNSKLLL